MNGYEQVLKNRIAEAGLALADAVNNSIVTPRIVGEALMRTHPYLLNEIALGVMYAVSRRAGDGRINPLLEKAALELFPAR